MAKFWPFNRQKAPKEKGRRSFAAAMYGRLVANWITASTSMDAEIKTSLRSMRDRSRQLGRDNDYIKGVFREFRNNIIGQGIPFQAQVKKLRADKLDAEINSQIEDKWSDWTNKNTCHTAGTLFFQDIERMLAGGLAESGEIFVRMIRQSFGGSKIPFALEIIESDQLDDLELSRSESGNEVRMGVEVDKWQRPVAYHFRTRHPGDYPFGGPNRPSERIRVPAEEIIHLGLKERPNQTRSIPLLHASIMRMHQVAGYEEAEVIAARATASLMGFVESAEGDALVDGKDGEGGATAVERVSDFQPGVFKYLAPGEKVTIPDTHRPSGQFEPFMRIMLRALSAGTGMAYSSVSKDSSQSNFSSSRIDLISERDNWRILQTWFIRNFHQVVYENWLDMAVLSGELNLPNYETAPLRYKKIKWMPRGWAWIDPVKEITASKEAILGGLSSLTNELSQQGEDVEEVFAQRAREIALAKTHKLTLDTDFANDKQQAPKAGPQAEGGGTAGGQAS